MQGSVSQIFYLRASSNFMTKKEVLSNLKQDILVKRNMENLHFSGFLDCFSEDKNLF